MIQDATERAYYIAQGWWSEETLSEVTERNARSNPDGAAFLWGDAVLTWAGYDALGSAIAARLAGEGAGPGDRVLVFLPDGGGVHAAYLGCERAGVIAVGIGWRAGAAELRALAGKTRPRVAILPERTPHGSASELCEGLGIESVLIMQDPDGAVGVADGATATAAGPGDPCSAWLINSTSGTTGLPKCVVQTQARWQFFHQLAVERGHLGDVPERFMSVLPAPFGFGLWTAHFTPTLLGAPCTVQARFDAREAAQRIAIERTTVLAAVSSQLVMILDAADDLGSDLSSLRIVFTGGERLPTERARHFEASTGGTVLNFYGSNETGTLSGTRVEDPLEKRLATGGRCIETMQVRLYDDSGRRIPGDVGVGIPACRGPATSPGYFEDEAANRELFTEDGWMLMGDYVEIDEDGWLTVIGRSADFIVRGGKNISAAAVENEVSSHPAVAQVAALAVPDARLGETVGVCVELRDGGRLDLTDLLEHLQDRGVSKEWWPEHLALLDTLPVSSGGKIAKGELRERVPELFG